MECPECNGKGKIIEYVSDNPEPYTGPCGCSGGSGCTACGGSGYISGGRDPFSGTHAEEIVCYKCRGSGCI